MTPQLTEKRITLICLAITATATAFLVTSTGLVGWKAFQEANVLGLLETLLFGSLAGFLAYGNLCYQLARIGRLERQSVHRPAVEIAFAPGKAPALSILVPSYKEEISTIRQTLLSAALQDYPNKRVVLLLDDPPAPKTDKDRAALWAARSLPSELRDLLHEPTQHILQEQALFRDRCAAHPLEMAAECHRMSNCYLWVSRWLEIQAKRSPCESHTDAWFTELVFHQAAEECRAHSRAWREQGAQSGEGHATELREKLDTAYAGLAARFNTDFDVFERKQYCNLSHEPNKAMNLNSYLGLMGRRVRPVLTTEGLALQETSGVANSKVIPDAPYVITLDADSLLRPHYARTLIQLMEQPEHANTAVAQTPYSAIPNAPGPLERTAGATTDIQYLVHQGFTHFGATFWVGANALIRKAALDDICVVHQEGRQTVRRYIQDRTVIEDTESTVDLLTKGWSLYNHPERLAYSATPPDFGSLVIQRARWANGGLLIFPKLLSFLYGAPKRLASFLGALMQVHYLTSLACAPLSVLLILVVPFSSELMTPWMLVAALPYFVLYARDLALLQYRPIRDLFRSYALNLLLIPVHLTGAMTSLRQAVLKTKIPFKRTPKISGRTRISSLHLGLQLVMVLLSIGLGAYYAWHARWIASAFPLTNAALLLYGVKQFIGFRELASDLLFALHPLRSRLTTFTARYSRALQARHPTAAMALRYSTYSSLALLLNSRLVVALVSLRKGC